MDKDTFLSLLSVEVADYKALLETQQSDWVVKGFIDIDKNVYTITNDTKVVSKIIDYNGKISNYLIDLVNE